MKDLLKNSLQRYFIMPKFKNRIYFIISKNEALIFKSGHKMINYKRNFVFLYKIIFKNLSQNETFR